MPLPSPPSGSSAEAVWHRRILEAIKEITPRDSADIMVSTNPRGGTTLALRSSVRQPASVQWKGEYIQGVSYETNDLVIRGSENLSSEPSNDPIGNIDLANAGLFIARKTVGPLDPAPTEPNTDAGEFWETMARFSTPYMKITEPGQGLQSIKFDARNPSGGSIQVALADCAGMTLSVRPLQVCVGELTRTIMVIASEPF